MSSVTPIRPELATVVMTTEPDERLVAHLESLLQEANAGQLQGIVWAGLYAADTTAWGRCGLVTRSVIGALEIAKMQCVRTSIEDDED